MGSRLPEPAGQRARRHSAYTDDEVVVPSLSICRAYRDPIAVPDDDADSPRSTRLSTSPTSCRNSRGESEQRRPLRSCLLPGERTAKLKARRPTRLTRGPDARWNQYLPTSGPTAGWIAFFCICSEAELRTLHNADVHIRRRVRAIVLSH